MRRRLESLPLHRPRAVVKVEPPRRERIARLFSTTEPKIRSRRNEAGTCRRPSASVFGAALAYLAIDLRRRSCSR